MIVDFVLSGTEVWCAGRDGYVIGSGRSNGGGDERGVGYGYGHGEGSGGSLGDGHGAGDGDGYGFTQSIGGCGFGGGMGISKREGDANTKPYAIQPFCWSHKTQKP